MNKITLTAILIAAITAILFLPGAFSLAQQDYVSAPEGDSLEQVSPEELQQLDDAIRTLQEQPSLVSETSAGNDFNLDIIWKTNTLTPHDYPGKALPSAYSAITIYALADVPKPENLVYTWLVDDISSNKDGPDLTGTGRNRFGLITFRTPGFVHRLRVAAQDPKTERSAAASLEIRTVQPELYLYTENNNVFSKMAGSTIDLAGGGDSNLMARAFYFNAAGVNDLDFNWYVNNSPRENTSAQAEVLPISIARGSPVGSQAVLKLDVRHKKDKDGVYNQAAVRTYLEVVK